MKRTLLVACVLVLATAGALTAQQDQPSTPPESPLAGGSAITADTAQELVTDTAATISGTVVSSAADSLVIETTSGTRMTFVVDAQSSVPVGLAPGTRVTVQYHNLAGGAFHAAEVTTDTGATAGATSATTAAGTATELDTSAETTPPAATSTYSTGTATTGATESAADTSADVDLDADEDADLLPATASSAPLAALAGLLALGAAVTLRAARRR
jgi:hypothetical protein